MAYEDDEVVENLKQWWSKYGTALILAVAVGLFSYAGWNYWTSSQANAAAEAQALQQQMQMAAQRLSNNPEDADSRAEVERLGEQLMNDYSRTPYASDATMLLAKIAVDSDDLAKAITLLKAVIDADRDDAEVALATSRLARVQAANGDYADALATLDSLSDSSLAAMVNELRGDIFIQQDKRDEAAEAYKAADAALAAENKVQPLLELKLADVGLEPAPRKPLALEQ